MSAITAIIPTYNRASLLPVAVRSIQAQTIAVASIIIVDDGSTDGSRDLVAEMARDDPRIRLIAQDHGGANRARNAGARAATSEWLGFLDSDDSWEPERLAAQLAAVAARPEAVAAFCGFHIIGADYQHEFLPPDDPSLLDLRCANVLSSTSAALVRREVLMQVGGFDDSLPSCQDWDLWFRLRRAGPFAVVRRPLVRINSGPHDRITHDATKVLNGHRVVFGRVKEGASGAERRRIEASHRLVLASIFKVRHEWRQALVLAGRSLLQRPTPWGARLVWSSATGMIRDGLRRGRR